MYLCCLTILYIVVCINYSHTPFSLSPLPFSPLANTSLLSIPVRLFLFCYIHSFFFFLDFTYEWYHISLILLSMIFSRSTNIAANFIFFFWLSSTPLYMYITHLPYPFICWWTLRLFPYISYCKQCCSEHRDVCTFLN